MESVTATPLTVATFAVSYHVVAHFEVIPRTQKLDRLYSRIGLTREKAMELVLCYSRVQKKNGKQWRTIR